MRIHVSLDSYFGEDSGSFSVIKRRIPWVEAHRVTCVFNIEVSKTQEEQGQISVRPRFVFPGSEGTRRAFWETEFHELGPLSKELAFCRTIYKYSFVPPSSGTCEIQLSFNSLNDKDKIIDEFGVNNTGRDRDRNRYYTKPVRVYSIYEIAVFFFAGISTFFAAVTAFPIVMSLVHFLMTLLMSVFRTLMRLLQRLLQK